MWESGSASEYTDDDALAPAPALLSDDVVEDDEGPEQGFVDRHRVVRIWEEAGRLTKVRVSPSWHSKLGRSSLDVAFSDALSRAHARVMDVDSDRTEVHSDVDESRLPRFNANTFAQFRAAFIDVERRWTDAMERSEAQQPPPGPLVTGISKGVTVTLDDVGQARTVSFAPRWLETAQAGDICTHVMRAASTAYARFIPVENDREELDGIDAEHQQLLHAFEAMLNPKERQ